MRRKTKGNKGLVFSDFYCMSCGNKSFSLPRNSGRIYPAFHRKRMYCPNCRIEVNHIECRNDEEVYEFKLDFEEGKFKEECIESINYVQSNGSRYNACVFA